MAGLRWAVYLLIAVAFSGMTAQSTAVNIAEQFLLVAANQDRATYGLPPLRADEHLAVAARLHASEMARRKTISHRFDGERELALRGSDAGARFSLITENVAEGPDAAMLHGLWMKSPGHRANLLDPLVDSVGIAVVRSAGEFYAVEDFARIVQLLTLAEQESAVIRLVQEAGVQRTSASAAGRQTCEAATGFAGVHRPSFVMRYTSADLARLPAELLTRLATGAYKEAVVGACPNMPLTAFSGYRLAVLLYP